MPLYVYQVIEADGSEGEVFEVLQGMAEPPLLRHPESGKPVHRLLSAPNLPGKHADANVKSSLSDVNLARHGFTKYVKSGEGTYEKTAGDGPSSFRPG